MLRIYLTNLGKYNEDELIGEWLDLPCTDEELEEAKERIEISDEPDENGNYYEEWFITDYETDIQGLTVGEYDNLDELNELAETLDDLDEYEREIVEAMISEGYSLEDAIDKKEDCMIYYNCEDMEDVAREYAEETDFLIVFQKICKVILILRHMGAIWVLKAILYLLIKEIVCRFCKVGKKMINIDMWYGDDHKQTDKIDITFYPNEGKYRGNIYKDGKYISDYVCTDCLELEKSFPQLVFNWDWTQ